MTAPLNFQRAAFIALPPGSVEETARLIIGPRLISRLRRCILRVVVIVIRLLLRIGLCVVEAPRAAARCRIARSVVGAVSRIDVAVIGTLRILARCFLVRSILVGRILARRLTRRQRDRVAGVGIALAVVDIAAGDRAIVEEFRKRQPQAKVLILGVFPRGAQPGTSARTSIAEINGELAKIADNRNVYYMDIGPAFLQPDGVLSTEVMNDGLHPTAKGYDLWGAATKDKVAELLR